MLLRVILMKIRVPGIRVSDRKGLGRDCFRVQLLRKDSQNFFLRKNQGWVNKTACGRFGTVRDHSYKTFNMQIKNIYILWIISQWQMYKNLNEKKSPEIQEWRSGEGRDRWVLHRQLHLWSFRTFYHMWNEDLRAIWSRFGLTLRFDWTWWHRTLISSVIPRNFLYLLRIS